MDLSKIPTEDLLALQSGDLSKVSTETLTQLQQAQSTKSPGLDTGLRAMTGSMNPTPPNIVPIEGQVPYTTGDEAAAAVAEKIAEAGGKAGYPTIGALAGTAAYAIPKTINTVAEAAIGGIAGKGAVKGAKAVGKGIGRAAEVIGAPLKSTSEAAIKVAEEGMGIVNKAIDTKLMGTEIGLTKNSSTIANVLNTMETKLAEGAKLAPQTLKNYVNYVGNLMKENKIASGSNNFAVASKTIAKARQLLSEAVPARAKSAKDLANAYKRDKILKGALKITGGAALLGGGGSLIAALRKLGG